MEFQALHFLELDFTILEDVSRLFSGYWKLVRHDPRALSPIQGLQRGSCP